VEALLAFAATLVAVRLSADLYRRYRDRRAPELAAWSAALAAYAVAAGALAWGAAYGWTEAAFRVYYLGGALLTAPLLGAGSLLLAGRRLAAPVALAYGGVAVGVAIAVPLEVSLGGTDVPEAQDVLALWPARVLAIVGNSLGTLAVVVVAVASFRARPLGNTLILAGVAVAALGSGLAGLGVGALAPAVAPAAVLLYHGFVTPSRRPVEAPAP
jgi:hypothetical protein